MTPTEPKDTVRIPAWLAACVFLGMAVFLLWEEHKVHIMGALPYLLLLACPLIHLFMHRGHGHGGHHTDENEASRKEENHAR